MIIAYVDPVLDLCEDCLEEPKLAFPLAVPSAAAAICAAAALAAAFCCMPMWSDARKELSEQRFTPAVAGEGEEEEEEEEGEDDG